MPLDLVADDLAHGRLIRVLQPYSDRMPALYLYYPQRNASPALKAVAELLRV